MRTTRILAPRLGAVLAGAALVTLALAGCTSTSSGDASSAGSSSSGSSSAPKAAPSAAVDLSTTSTSLGTVVVDGKGLTAYVFDKDTKGTTASACTGACATTWPAITSSSTTPKVSGVTGTVSTIPAAGGGNQVTIDGRPIYTFASDAAKGDVKGEGVGGIWWAVSASGAAIKN